MKYPSFLHWLPIALVVAIIFFTAKAGLVINASLEELTEHHTPTLISIQQMEADIFEGIQEAFSYVILGDVLEKQEFYEKSADFDRVAQEFQRDARLQEEEQATEAQAFAAIISAKNEYVASAEKMFADFEKLGGLPRKAVPALEESVVNLTDALNHLVDIEKQELDEHVKGLERTVTGEILLLMVLSALLLLLLFAKLGPKKAA